MPEVKRIYELENFIDQNKELQKLLKHLKEVQKQMIHAKEFHQPNQYLVYKQEYDAIYNKILDFPFVEEYLELLEEMNSKLSEITNIIENRINSYLLK